MKAHGYAVAALVTATLVLVNPVLAAKTRGQARAAQQQQQAGSNNSTQPQTAAPPSPQPSTPPPQPQASGSNTPPQMAEPFPGFDETFPPTQSSEFSAGLHRTTKKRSKKGVRESEHPVPMNSIEGTEFNRAPDAMPAVSMPIEVHRGGVSGGGGGVTSTGSSAIAKAWRDRLRELIQRDASAEAIERVMVDEMNAAGRNGDVGRALGIAVWEYTRIQGTSGRPMLTQAQARDIINMIADQAWKQHEQNTKRQRDDSDDDGQDERPSKRQRTSSPSAEE